MHTYLAAMIPQLARRLIEMYVPPGGVVLDPFCGGGAVLVEAITAGRSAVGVDINDLAILISRAKTKYIEREMVKPSLKLVLDEACKYDGTPSRFEPQDNIHFWFKEYMIHPLTALKRAIDRVLLPGSDLHTLFSVVFSATVRDISLTRRNEIRLRRMKEEDTAKFAPDVFEKFLTRAEEAALTVSQLPMGVSATVLRADARRLPFEDEQFNAIICSPPYGDERNGVPYVQFAKNMLLWLGYTRSQILASKRETLGWDKVGKTPPGSPTLLAALSKIDKYPISVREATAFYFDYNLALTEMARVISDRIIIVIGQRVLQNVIFDNAQITVELLSDIGIPLEHHFKRKLPTKRLPRMREFGAGIDHEHILVFTK